MNTPDKGKAGAGTQGEAALPPLYITNGSGLRVFLYNIALALGQRSLLSGVSQLVAMGVITEEQAIGIQPRPSLVQVLLSTGTAGGGDD